MRGSLLIAMTFTYLPIFVAVPIIYRSAINLLLSIDLPCTFTCKLPRLYRSAVCFGSELRWRGILR